MTGQSEDSNSAGQKNRTEFTKSYYNLGVEIDDDLEVKDEEGHESFHEESIEYMDEGREQAVHRDQEPAADRESPTKARGPTDWQPHGIPPDLVASAQRFKVVLDVGQPPVNGTQSCEYKSKRQTQNGVAEVHRKLSDEISGQPQASGCIVSSDRGHHFGQPAILTGNASGQTASQSQAGPTNPVIDYKKILSDRYRNLEDLLDGEPWEEDVFTSPPNKVDLVVRLSEGFGGRYTYFEDDEQGYSGVSRGQRLLVQRLGVGLGRATRTDNEIEDGSTVPWLEQCGLSNCSSSCAIM